MVNIEDYIYAQYQDTPIAEISRSLDALDKRDYGIVDSYIKNNLLSIKNADTYGLNCWGSYLGHSRVYTIPVPTIGTDWFGFSVERLNFIGNFSDGRDSFIITLDDELYRLKLIMEAFLIRTPMDLFSINKALLLAFGGGIVTDTTIYDPLDPIKEINPMKIVYYIHLKKISTVHFLALNNYYLPKPACVRISDVFWDQKVYNGLYLHNAEIEYSQ